MENGAKGCEIVISGKLRAQRAKAMKFRDGYMLKSGAATTQYIDYATSMIKLKQGVLGLRVKIMLPHDPTGKEGVAIRLPDVVTVLDPKDEQPLLGGASTKQGYAQNFQAGQHVQPQQVPEQQPPQHQTPQHNDNIQYQEQQQQ